MNTPIQTATVLIVTAALISVCVAILVRLRKTAPSGDDTPDEAEYIIDDNLEEFFFTYADPTGEPFKHYPYKAGWSRVLAPSITAAEHAFRAFHPDYFPGILNCVTVYRGDIFRKTSIYLTGNYGEYEHETITVSRQTVIEKGEHNGK